MIRIDDEMAKRGSVKCDGHWTEHVDMTESEKLLFKSLKDEIVEALDDQLRVELTTFNPLTI